MKEAILSFSDLSIGYHRECCLFENLKLQLYPGELVCLLGPNGAGKSTLIKTILGLIEPLSGEIQLCSKKVSTLSGLERAKLMSAMLTDRVSGDHLKVMDLVLLGRYPYRKGFGQLSEHDHSIAEQSLERVNALSLKERRVDTLSDGERQRVMLARAMTQDPKLLILDEPTSFLDYPHKVESFDLLKTWVKHSQGSVFLSTHDLELSLQFADRVVLLVSQGDLIQGAPEDLILNGELDRIFQSELLKLNRETGRFDISMKTDAKVQLKGEGARHSWTQQALRRSGFSVDECSTTVIEVTSTDWYLKAESESFRFQSIYELLKQLKALRK